MKLSDLICSRDGSLSLTKLAAATAHPLLAFWFCWLTYRHGFIAELWLTYGGFAVGHATADKVLAVINTKKQEVTP